MSGLDTPIPVFEEARPRLLGIAYRILGSRAEAEDAVQDTFLRWCPASAPVRHNWLNEEGRISGSS